MFLPDRELKFDLKKPKPLKHSSFEGLKIIRDTAGHDQLGNFFFSHQLWLLWSKILHRSRL